MYNPREDSFLIQKHIKAFCKSDSNFSVLDLGTGSGMLALEASKYAKSVTASDIDENVIKELKKNLKGLIKKEKQNPKFYAGISLNINSIKFIHSNLFLKIKNKFDLIIFNPPYIPTKKNETRFTDLDGGKNGTEIIKRFLKQAKQFLKKEGKILLLTSSLNKNVTKLFDKYHYTYKLLDEKKFFFEKIFVWELN